MKQKLPSLTQRTRAARHWRLCLLAIAAGSLVSPNLVSSQETNVAEVIDEHCDFRILYQPQETNALAIVLADEDHGLRYSPDDVVMVAAESSRTILPAGTPFGEEGEAIWLLPQSQIPDLLYLGVSAEGIQPGVFSRPFNLRLIAVQGPGEFFAWQAGDLGGLSIKMNTRDGVSEADRTTPIAGSHEHLNWGFTSNGVYRVTFQADGQRTGESTNLVSEPTTFTFHVLPLPAEPPRLTSPQKSEGGEFSFELTGTVGARYHIEVTKDLRSWLEAETVQLDASPARVRIGQPPLNFGVYRARQF